MRGPLRFFLILLLAYVGTYAIFRSVSQEVWTADGQAYVIFPAEIGKLLYYYWRPLSYLDGALTGMRFHIGPHV